MSRHHRHSSTMETLANEIHQERDRSAQGMTGGNRLRARRPPAELSQVPAHGDSQQQKALRAQGYERTRVCRQKLRRRPILRGPRVTCSVSPATGMQTRMIDILPPPRSLRPVVTPLAKAGDGDSHSPGHSWETLEREHMGLQVTSWCDQTADPCS